MPNVNLHQQNNEPPRQYPYHLLMINNYRLPPGIFPPLIPSFVFLIITLDVDRCHLERHLQVQIPLPFSTP